MSRISLPLTFVIAALLTGSLFGQELSYVQGEVIVQFKPKLDARQFVKNNQRFQSIPTKFRLAQAVSRSLNIWKFTFDYAAIHEKHFIYHLQKEPGVIGAQLNRFVELRSTTPDDPFFDNQWQYINTGQFGGSPGSDLDIDLAWDVTTGGLTANGDTIVVCVIDNGMETTHQDFQDVLWFNHAETPGNGLDDDNNGFIDDYRGWNVSKDNDEISADNFHGTPVAGIIGAKGNNGVGIAGVNWNVKLMTITTDFPSPEAEILKAYDYALIQRKAYNDSGGERGAFVVATNASWGIPNEKAADSPIWCALYDELGQEGILNIVATDNSNLDVDKKGDMPSSCPSDFIISVTNIDNDGNKVTESGFGSSSIDLGAYGGSTLNGVWTVDTFNDYGPFCCTSASTPHVTGTVALLYAAPCPSISELALANPSATALLIKDYMLASAIPNPTLEGITVTGGQLNIDATMQYLLENCTDCIALSKPSIENLTDKEAILSWNLNPGIAGIDLRWRMENSETWAEIENVTSPFKLGGLVSCTPYEIQVKTNCESESLGFSESIIFSSAGCCEPPPAIDFVRIDETLAFGEWDEIFGANEYIVRYRAEGNSEWIQQTAFGNNEFFNDLNSCTTYEIEIATKCGDVVGEFNRDLTFTTLGCGACFESEYCVPRNLNADSEWIEFVRIDTFENKSQSDGGYGDFTDLSTIVLEQNKAIELELTPGFPEGGISFNEFFKIWIDYNQNGIFNSNELVWANESGTNETITASWTIPSEAILGNTRMRIGMLGLAETISCPFSVSKFGEYEDYCIEITNATSTSTVETSLNQPIFKVFPNPVGLGQITVETKFPTLIKTMYLELLGANGISYYSTEINNHPANVSQSRAVETDQLPVGVYFLRLRSSGKKTLIRKVVVISP